jgi:hypothetical protein
MTRSRRLTAGVSPLDWPRHLRWWFVALVPFVVFAPALFLEFGLRDDYSILREAREEPWKLVAFCNAQGRFLYGWLLQASFEPLGGVRQLVIGRLLCVLCIGLIGALVARVLVRRLQWGTTDAVIFGSLLTMLPAPQVISNWAICWPHAFAGVLGVTAFSLAERGLAFAGARRVRLLLAALAVMIAGILTYQSNVLLYLVPVAAGWLRVDPRRGWRWLTAHLGFVAGALGTSFLLTLTIFRLFGLERSNRVAIEWHWMAKLAWAAAFPLREGLGMFVVRDALGRTDPWYGLAQAITAGAIFTALATSSTRASESLQRTAGWLATLFAAYAVSFVAIERWASYRTLWPMMGVLLAAAYIGVRRWIDAMGEERLPVQRAVATAVIATVTLSAAWNSRQLLAVPQAREWARMREIASRFDPAVGGQVFVVLPRSSFSPSPLRHLDEFGSLSSDADWAAKEMFKQALRAGHPSLSNPAAKLVWQSGYARPSKIQNARVLDISEAGKWMP